MLKSGKTLGQFITEVLSVVSTAVYVPAAVLSGGFVLSALLAVSDEDNPIRAVAEAPSPGFAELAWFVLLVALVAALLDPLQFQITRFFEGQTNFTPRSRLTTYQDEVEKQEAAFNELLDDLEQIESKLSSAAEEEKANIRLEKEAKSLELRMSALVRDRLPQADRLLPYRLGNIVRAYEDRSTVELRASGHPLPGNKEIQDFLPFAYFAVPDITRREHDTARAQMQSLCALTVVAPASATMVALSMVTFGSWGLLWAGGAFVVGLIVSIAAHAGARDAGDAYGSALLAISRQYAAGALVVESSADGAAETPVAA